MHTKYRHAFAIRSYYLVRLDGCKIAGYCSEKNEMLLNTFLTTFYVSNIQTNHRPSDSGDCTCKLTQWYDLGWLHIS